MTAMSSARGRGTHMSGISHSTSLLQLVTFCDSVDKKLKGAHCILDFYITMGNLDWDDKMAIAQRKAQARCAYENQRRFHTQSHL